MRNRPRALMLAGLQLRLDLSEFGSEPFAHGMCRKMQVNHTCRASPPTWKTAGFKPFETIPPVLPSPRGRFLDERQRFFILPMEPECVQD
jgi:hypothetical protein